MKKIIFTFLALLNLKASGDAMYRGNSGRTGVLAGQNLLLIPDNERFTIKIVGQEVANDPILDGNMLYFSDYKILYAMDAIEGVVKWKFIPGVFGTGTGISPVAVVKGLVYFVARDHHFYSLNATTGKLNYKVKLDYAMTGSLESLSSPLIENDVAYFGYWDKNLYAVDCKNGQIKWKVPVESEVFGPLALEGERLILKLAAPTGNIAVAHDKNTGHRLWTYALGGYPLSKYAPTNELPIVGGGMLFVPGANSILGINTRSGKESLKFEFPQRVLPEVLDGHILYVNHWGKLGALNLVTGQMEWEGISGGENVTLIGDVLYFANGTHSISAIHKKRGKLLWKKDLPYSAQGGSYAVGLGYIYAGMQNGLTAYRP